MVADEAARVRLGASAATHPDLLLELARDPSVKVRASLALNPALPDHITAILAVDADARVRTILSRKLASLTSCLPEEDRHRLQQEAIASLTAMVADAAQRVRASIAEAIRDLPDGPREIVLRLAHDPAVMVSEPVILFSPMLTQEDLVALIASGAPSTTVHAVARRPSIGVEVSDAIVGTSDTAAITALLGNKTAQIREATLDALAAQSEEQTDWQEPLVRRPHLPPRAQMMLAEIVTGHLLEALATRDDLDPRLGDTLRAVLRRAAADMAPKLGGTGGVAADDMDVRTAMGHAHAMLSAGKLDDYAILDALRANSIVTAKAILAVMSGVSIGIVERVCVLRNAKAMVSLAWRARLSAQTATVLQTMLAHLPPNQVLRPTMNGDFPLAEAEMTWQLAFLEGSPRAAQVSAP